MTEENNFLLLNKTPKNNFTPYKFRKYIPLTDSKNNTINLRYYDGGKIININDLSNIKKIPLRFGRTSRTWNLYYHK